MSRSTAITLRCDRCTTTLPLTADRLPADWGSAYVLGEVFGRRVVLGSAEAPVELCPGCLSQLVDWFRAADGATPAPIAPSAPDVRRLSLKQRRALLPLLVDEVRDAITRAIETVREEPTSILSQGIVPGVFAGVDDSAARLLAAVSDVISHRKGRPATELTAVDGALV